MIYKGTFLMTLFLCQFSFAQKVKTIELEKICEPIQPEYYLYVEDVEEFIDTLTLRIQISSVTNGREVSNESLTFSEKIINESSIVQLSKEVALSICLARIVDQGKKYYIYSIHLYKKEGKCWEDINSMLNWSKCNLGVINSGYGIGNQGSSNFVGYTGNITLQ